MTSKRSSQPDAEHLAEVAAEWFARMRGPDADRSQHAFHRWIDESPQHLAAFNDIAELFSLAKGLRRPSPKAPQTAVQRGRIWLGVTAFAIAVTTLALALAILRFGLAGVPSGSQPASHAIQYAATSDEQRGIGLVDGSTVVLDMHSRLTIDYGPDRRTLTLLEGRARFDVAHEPRPFVVLAGGNAVTAHGTIFDVSLSGSRQAVVRLLRGAIDVDAAPSHPDHLSQELKAGEEVRVTAGAAIDRPSVSTGRSGAWLHGLIDYDQAPLSALLSAANRQSNIQIELADRGLGRLRVSGAFSLEDPRQLAHALAVSLGLEVEPQNDGRILMLHPAS